jgi:hypothetical protein
MRCRSDVWEGIVKCYTPGGGLFGICDRLLAHPIHDEYAPLGELLKSNL